MWLALIKGRGAANGDLENAMFWAEGGATGAKWAAKLLLSQILRSPYDALSTRIPH